MKKICYVVVMSTRKLRHYFEAHRVRVLTNQWLNNIFRNRDSSGRIGKWAMELAEHVIDFEKMSYLIFMPQPSTHRMHDPGSIVPHIWPKVFTDNQMS
jgi:hypothetical protein